MPYKGYTKEQGHRANKYISATMEQVSLKVWKGDKAKLEKVAEESGCSVRQYIIAAVNEKAGYDVLTVSKRPSSEVASRADQESE